MRARTVAGAAALAGASAYEYVRHVRPWIDSWGCLAEERHAPLPGDDIVAEPGYIATHGVAIDAGPSAVWPWVVQLGQGRGGLYSYDWLENAVGCDINSLDHIDATLQHLDVGDSVRLYPESEKIDLRYEVVRVIDEHALVLITPGSPDTNFAKGLPFATWAFVLRPHDDGTRLLVRTRSAYGHELRSALANHYALEPIHFLMERKMLLGIKARAERMAGAALATAL